MQIVKIKNIGKVVGGATPRSSNEAYFNGDIPWITPKDLSNYNSVFIKQGERNLSKFGLQSCSAKLLPKGTVLFSSRAPIGYVAIADNELSTNQGFKSIICDNEKVNNLYLYYYFKLNKENIEAAAAGSTFKEINKATLENFEINIHDNLEEQKQIAEILSSLDDKIELNRKINTNLEKLAGSLFKKWFVDIGDEYQIINLGKVLSAIESGRRPKGGAQESGVPSVGAENVNGLGHYDYSSTKYIPKEFYKKMKTGKVKDYDILLYKDGAYIGRKTMFGLGFPFDEFAINEHVFILRSNSDLVDQFYLYFYLNQIDVTENIQHLNTNSAQPGINQESMKGLEIKLPQKEIMNKFGTIARELVSLILKNSLENRELANLRDFLLSRLMSGKIRVNI